MAYSGTTPQTLTSSPLPIHAPIQSEDEADVYNLDDPFLVPKIIHKTQQGPRRGAESITCRFLAIPLDNKPGMLARDEAQYVHVLHESSDKFIVRLPRYRPDLINRVRQLWVCKYVAPYTECRITFDAPRGLEEMMQVIVQRVLPKISTKEGDESGYGNGNGDGGSGSDEDTVMMSDGTEYSDTVMSDSTEFFDTTEDQSAATDDGQEALLPEEVPYPRSRRRAMSLPLPNVLTKLGERPWHLRQVLQRW